MDAGVGFWSGRMVEAEVDKVSVCPSLLLHLCGRSRRERRAGGMAVVERGLLVGAGCWAFFDEARG